MKLAVSEAAVAAGLLLGVAGSVALRSVIAGQFYCAGPLDPAVLRRLQKKAHTEPPRIRSSLRWVYLRNGP
jgi:hypothetical protein